MTELYPATTAGAFEMLNKVGGETFRQAPAVCRTIENIVFSAHKDPRATAWSGFIEDLHRNDLLGKAFNAAWPDNGVVDYILKGSSLTLQAAEEISQETALKVWKGMRAYKPWLMKWQSWLLMIARRELITWNRYEQLRMQLRTIERDYTELLDREPETSSTVPTGWSIPIVCDEWIKRHGGHGRAKLASMIVVAYDGGGYLPPTSAAMQEITGASVGSLHSWWHEFIEEVLEREGV
jgi:hypothetical protein